MNKRIIKSNDEAAGNASFNTVLYTGTGSGSKSVTGVGFQPDLVWGKARTDAISHILFDSVRGENKQLSSNTESAEVVRGSDAYLFDPDGFTVTTVGNLNNAEDYVAWNFRAGGAAVTNTDGTITSQVSANTDAGFSIVSYTGNGTANSTIGHGLGVKPDIVLVKGRSSAYAWQLYSSAISTATYPTLNGRLHLYNATAAIFDSYTVEVADNTFKWTGLASTFEYFNYNNATYVAYCFAEVAGFSKFGSYSGNSSTQSINVGFEPAMIILKGYNTTYDWVILDNKRGTDNRLFPNLSDAESPLANRLTFTSTGFNLLTASYNSTGQEFIYMAFANQF
jgi:hypothetical protein